MIKPSDSLDHPEEEVHSLANALRSLRLGLDLSQSEFGRRLGVDAQTVSRWETGKSDPRFTLLQVKNLLQILEEAKVNLSDLPNE